ncbi:Ribosomal protein S6 kinase alpha-5 [Leucoagaricus sp. SymC.cos]|nr:Ribosomal protein S6 kinase alpha-5 [Leucoagaricus sp. SymC.cos]
MDSQPPPADEPDILASVQLLLSQIDSESRALEVVSKANNLSREEIQLLVDALSTSLDKDNAFTRSQAYICLTLVKIASATNVVSRNRTIKFESMTPAGDDDIFTITGQTPCQVKVVRRNQDDSSTVSNRPEGTVYAAQHTQNHSEELIRWAHLTHPNILPVYATFSNDNNLIFVSPCLPEANACDHAQRLPKEQRLPLILDVANGLSYLHQLNIIHGGLTPEAVLISSEGHALIAALDATPEAEVSDSLPTRYSAPEILEDENTRPTKAVDIWSFACFSYEVLSGQVPFFQISKDNRVSVAIVRGNKPLRTGQGGVGGDEIIDDIWHLLLMCWEQEAGNRAGCSRVKELLMNMPIQGDRPTPKLAIGPDALDGYTTNTKRVKTVVTQLLGFGQPSALQIPEHLRNSLYKLVNNEDERSATAVAAKKLSPGEIQVLVDFLDLVISDSLHVPTDRLLSNITASTHTVPSSCMVKGVRFDSTTSIMEGLHTKAYKGRGLNIRVDVVMNSNTAASPRICLITPLLENGSLRNYAPSLPQKSRLPLIADVINGLAYIHSTWDIHIGSLHGQRVMISNDGRAMIADSVSHYPFLEFESVNAYESYFWRFEPPPLLYRPGPKNNIWSFGCVCYEVLTQKVPYYQYPDDHEVVTHNSKAELPRRPDRSDDDTDEIDDKAWDLITRCCAQNPDDLPDISQIQEMVVGLGIEDNRPVAKPLVGPEVLALRSRPKIDFDQAETALGKIQASHFRFRYTGVSLLFAYSNLIPMPSSKALKDHLSISDERNRVLAILSKITSVTHIFPQRYELNGVKYCPQPIAEGGFGNVHQGVDPSMCVKVMKRLDPNALTPWIKELILWAHSSHPNVLPFYGVFTEGTRDSPQTCLVSPFMKNGNLHDYAPHLSQKSRLALISDIVHGLHYLHELGIVHGDLKGQNVLISDEGQCLITDFGASHITTATTASGSLSVTTLRFSAPEMILGNKKPSKEFDIWSVGCLFYEVLSRKEPYYEYKYEVQIIAALSRKELPTRPGTTTNDVEEKDDWDDDFDQDWDTIDDQAWSLITRCCTPEPENRPNMSIVKELVKDLKIWDDRPAAKTIPGAEILKLRSEPKIDLVRVEELLDQLQHKLDARPESASLTTSVTSP